MGGEQREGTRVARAPEPLEHPGAIRAECPLLDPFGDHQLARLRAAGASHLELADARTDRPDAEPLAEPLECADDTRGRARQHADDLALGLVGAPADPRQHTITDRWRLAAAGVVQQHDRGRA
jgi:hypothetical protein